MMSALANIGKTHPRLEVTHEKPNMWESCLQVSPISLIKIETNHAKNFLTIPSYHDSTVDKGEC
jgi:hypothetical protein